MLVSTTQLMALDMTTPWNSSTVWMLRNTSPRKPSGLSGKMNLDTHLVLG